MARLPNPGGDEGHWGNVLNDFLSTTHNTDGTLKDNVVSSSALAPNAVDTNSIQDATISEVKLDAALVAKVNASSSGVAPDATPSIKGIVRLSGDLSGTADAPTVPGLAGKASNTVTVTGVTSLTGGGDLTANRTIGLVNDAATPGNSQYYGTDGAGAKGYHAIPVATIANGSITPVKLNSDVPANGEFLSYNGTGFEWITPATVAKTGAYSDLIGTPAAAIPLTEKATWPIVPSATTATVDYNTGSSAYPPRPTSRTDVVVRWRGPVAPTVGGAGAVDNVDEWVNTP